ncbi:MAG: GNAT family N-acetyltransferase [Dehalococcoidia bacterium]
MEVRIVEARPQHAAFLAWVMLTAHRSHLERGMWDLVVGDSEAECLRFLEALATTDEPHWAHYSTFIVAEADGRPAAALCGYLDRELGTETLALRNALPEVNRAVGRTDEEAMAGWQRAASILYVAPQHADGAWVVENVATLPEFRRRGLVDRLLAEILDRGRRRGAAFADVGVLIGNDPAQRAYEKAGFEVIAEKRHPEFEAVYGSPGIRLLSRAL